MSKEAVCPEHPSMVLVDNHELRTEVAEAVYQSHVDRGDHIRARTWQTDTVIESLVFFKLGSFIHWLPGLRPYIYPCWPFV